jgi:hypothetical protein
MEKGVNFILFILYFFNLALLQPILSQPMLEKHFHAWMNQL